MGETGPCGPCSELHFDRGPEHACDKPDCGIDCECDRYLEIWNLVFMQYDRDSNGNLTPLPNPSIDTGMGLERLVSIVQNKDTNFETDLLVPIIHEMEKLTDFEYGKNAETDISFRVIGDHVRAGVFLIADGIVPANEGRGYVLRRIIRRALRHGRMLGVEKPFAYRLVEKTTEIMESAYPDLLEHKEIITSLIKGEEESFGTTLDYGMKLISKIIDETGKRGDKTISGEDLFSLYDTYGFPIDLAGDIFTDAGFILDRSGFEKLMKQQQEKARSSWKGAAGKKENPLYKPVFEKTAPTDFTGYETEKDEATVLAIIGAEGELDSAKAGESVEIVLDKTPFYAESGGQASDTGEFVWDEGRAKVIAVAKPDGSHFVHTAKIIEGELQNESKISALVDSDRRQKIRRNHSATHLLHAALRQRLGTHVKQAGSAVDDEKLRFDFSHFSQPDKNDLKKIERLVNEHIFKNELIETQIKSIEEATEGGAMALFGEKYGDKVRVVSMGDFSMELCGGTHAGATGDIGTFKIVGESAVSAGVRRIEAVTGTEALDLIESREQALHDVATAVNASGGSIALKVQKQMEKIKELEKENRTLKEKLVAGTDSDDPIIEVKGVKLLAKILDGADSPAMRSFVDDRKNRLGSAIIVVGAEVGGKALLTVGVTDDLTKKFSAGEIIKQLAPIVGGGGGGRPDMAQAGGKNPEHLASAIDKCAEIIEKMAG